MGGVRQESDRLQSLTALHLPQLGGLCPFVEARTSSRAKCRTLSLYIHLWRTDAKKDAQLTSRSFWKISEEQRRAEPN